jgi:hypothetical protein
MNETLLTRIRTSMSMSFKFDGRDWPAGDYDVDLIFKEGELSTRLSRVR